MRVLIVEDEAALREQLVKRLRAEGYAVDAAGDGEEALYYGCEYPVDVAVVDLGLPKLSGVDVIRTLRAREHRYPVLILTAHGRWQDKVEGLEAGADDYLVKPFEMDELDARLRALLRRAGGEVAAGVLRVADLRVDTGTLEVSRAGQALSLAPIGLKLLIALMRASPRVLSRQALEREVWGSVAPDSDALRSHLYNLRKVIDKPFGHPLLHTVAGMGYRLAERDGD